MGIDAGESYLDKARESVTGARVAYEAGRFNNSANRSYYACFQAAIHALILEGIRPPGGSSEWGHDFVPSQFVGNLINRMAVPIRPTRSAETTGEAGAPK